MPKSPAVSFNFENNNTQTSVPASGITHVVARTTKGQFISPHEVITTITQFRSKYGREIVPDGTISNIERALSMGSALRISRVPGGTAVAFGEASTYVPSTGVSTPKALVVIKVQNPMDATQNFIVSYRITTREPGSAVVNPGSDNVNSTWFMGINQKVNGPMATISITQATDVFIEGNSASFKADRVIATTTLLVKNNILNSSNNSIDVNTLKEFINSAPNITLAFESCTGSIPNIDQIKTLEDTLSLLGTYNTWFAKVSIGDKDLNPQQTQFLSINEGNNGGASTPETWEQAAVALMDYNDAYSIIASHLHQHLKTAYTTTYNAIFKHVEKTFECKLLVEIPKYSADGSVKLPSQIITEAAEIAGSMDYSKSAAIFAGGIKLYDDAGNLRNCDVLGTVIGLENATATTAGQWYSFSGMNRGLVPGARGPVTTNLGSPTKYDELNQLAAVNVNLFVVKPTTTAGTQTMLWHGFTCFYLDNSNKFISSVNLSLYLKKQLRPILESQLEEPNNFSLWRNIYYLAKEVVDNLVPSAMSSYEWMGDQFATSFEECTMNTEASARAGKYRARLRYKDVVTLQEVEMTFEVDSSTREITIS